MCRLHASNHTLLSGTKVCEGVSGLMHLCKAFYASVLDFCSFLRHSCAAGTLSSGVVINAVELIPNDKFMQCMFCLFMFP
jgi:hypothetical protein